METFRILDIQILPYSGDPYIHIHTCVGIRKRVTYIEWLFVQLMGIRVQEIVPDPRVASSVPHSFHEQYWVGYALVWTASRVRLYWPLQLALRGRAPHRVCFSNPTLILLTVPWGVKRKRVGPISDVFIAVQDWLRDTWYKRNAKGIAPGF